MPTVDSLLAAALTLSPADRTALADRLLESLPAGDELHPDWRAEFDHRTATHDAGGAAAVPWAEVQARAERRLADQQEPARG